MAIDNEFKSTWEKFALKTKGKFQYDESIFPLGDKFKCEIECEIDDYKIHFIAKQNRTATTSALGRKVFTKVFIPLAERSDFRFSVYPESFAAKVLKAFGLQDITIGNDLLDHKFIFKGNHANSVKNIFIDELITKLLLANPDFNIKLQHGEGLMEMELPENHDFLLYETDQLIRDENMLGNILTVFVAVMTKLKNEKNTMYNIN